MTKLIPKPNFMKTILLLVVMTLVFAVAGVAQASIDSIRKSCDDTDKKLAEMQEHPELSSVFVVELAVNKHSAPYPAVGIYQRTASFYYTYGDREKNPYPDKLMKIAAVYKRSSRVETIDFYFDKSGQMIFALAANPEGTIKETRLYFAAGKLVKMTDDGKAVGLRTQHAAEAAALAAKESARLSGIFRQSLIDND